MPNKVKKETDIQRRIGLQLTHIKAAKKVIRMTKTKIRKELKGIEWLEGQIKKSEDKIQELKNMSPSSNR